MEENIKNPSPVSKKSLRSFQRFFSGTLLSRLSGFGRDLMMAMSFADHPSVAAFMIAFRFSNMFRRLFGEGAFQSAFIPYFEELKVKEESKALIFFQQLFVLMAVVLICLTIFIELLLFAWSHFFSISPSNYEIVNLTRLLLPGVIFICLYGLNLSFLYCYGCFFIPNFSPVLCNVIWIGICWKLKNTNPSSAMLVLAKGVVVGFFLQWLFTFPLVLRYLSRNWKEWLIWKIPPEVKKLIYSFTFGALSVGALQINHVCDSIFARVADLRGPTYLWYSMRIIQLVLAVLAMACITPRIPKLSNAIKRDDLPLAYRLFERSYREILSLMLCSTTILIIVGPSFLSLIYGRGHFSIDALWKTTLCLWGYMIGIIPTAALFLLTAVFYARNYFYHPLLIALVSLITNLGLNSLFIFFFHWGSVSTALSTSCSSWINYFLLLFLLKKQGWPILFTFSRWIPLIAGNAIAGIFSICLAFVLGYDGIFFQGIAAHSSFARDLFTVTSQTVFFIVALFSLGWMIKNQDLLAPFYLVFSKSKEIENIEI